MLGDVRLNLREILQKSIFSENLKYLWFYYVMFWHLSALSLLFMHFVHGSNESDFFQEYVQSFIILRIIGGIKRMFFVELRPVPPEEYRQQQLYR